MQYADIIVLKFKWKMEELSNDMARSGHGPCNCFNRGTSTTILTTKVSGNRYHIGRGHRQIPELFLNTVQYGHNPSFLITLYLN